MKLLVWTWLALALLISQCSSQSEGGHNMSSRPKPKTEDVADKQSEPIGRPTGAISKKKCNKYALFVFEEEYNGITGQVQRVNTCPDSEPLIFTGTYTEPREFPHVALIGFGDENSITWQCGASLISERFLLGAAHCVHQRVLEGSWARLGDFDINSQEDEDYGVSQAITVGIAQIHRHPDYRPESILNDIALFQLKDDVELNKFIRPTCLHTDNELPHYAAATGWGVGWLESGLDYENENIMQKYNMTIISNETLEKQYSHMFGGKEASEIGNEKIIVTVPTFPPKDICKGDSGGPLQLPLDRPYCMYDMLGVSSICKRNGNDVVIVYTKVSSYIDWIESIVWPFEQKKSHPT